MNASIRKLALGTVGALIFATSAFACNCQTDCRMFCKQAFPDDPAAQYGCYQGCVLGCSDSEPPGGGN